MIYTQRTTAFLNATDPSFIVAPNQGSIYKHSATLHNLSPLVGYLSSTSHPLPHLPPPAPQLLSRSGTRPRPALALVNLNLDLLVPQNPLHMPSLHYTAPYIITHVHAGECGPLPGGETHLLISDAHTAP
jgi:hypothetical protein